MTATDSAPAASAPRSRHGSTPPAPSDRPLRLTLRANAAMSLVFGTVGLIGASRWSELFGFDHVALTAVVSASLIVFGADVWWLSTRPTATLRRSTPAVSLLDGLWVAASVAIIIAGLLTTAGTVLAATLAVVVADFGVSQMWFRRRLAG